MNCNCKEVAARIFEVGTFIRDPATGERKPNPDLDLLGSCQVCSGQETEDLELTGALQTGERL